MKKTKKTKKLPRGLRNRNPLNIRKSDQLWQGQTGNDGTFCIFLNNAYGYRAGFRHLKVMGTTPEGISSACARLLA